LVLPPYIPIYYICTYKINLNRLLGKLKFVMNKYKMFGKLYNHYSTIGERIVLFKKPNKKLTYLILHFGVMKTNELFRLYTINLLVSYAGEENWINTRYFALAKTENT